MGNAIRTLMGKEVVIYPEDTNRKTGIIMAVDTNGILFKITDAIKGSGYTVGKLHFIAYSAKLSFAEI